MTAPHFKTISVVNTEILPHGTITAGTKEAEADQQKKGFNETD